MAQTVRIKPRRCGADEVQGFTTTRVVGLDVQTLYLAGELDLYRNAEATAAFAIAVGAGLPIVVDLTDLDFMDCGGYRAIATARRTAEQQGIALTITHAHGEPARLLNLLGEHRRGTAAASASMNSNPPTTCSFPKSKPGPATNQPSLISTTRSHPTCSPS